METQDYVLKPVAVPRIGDIVFKLYKKMLEFPPLPP